jgi:hypothetical protein
MLTPVRSFLLPVPVIFVQLSLFGFRSSERVLESPSITARSRPPSPTASAFLSPATIIYLIIIFCFRVAAKLAPEDPEITFNLASVLEAC